jgi:peptidoglycan/LPS O-acetylase OafA/YrhL
MVLQNPSQNRLQFLDALRAVAALSVLWEHTLGGIMHWDDNTKIAYFFPMGSFGVNLFFICSGFVIPMSLKYKKSMFATIENFWLRRIFRLFPLYWFMFAITLLYDPNLDAKRIVSSIFMSGVSHSVVPCTWTLAFEMFFYFFITVVFLKKKLNDTFLIGILFIILQIPSAYGMSAYSPTFTNIASFFIGHTFQRYYNQELSHAFINRLFIFVVGCLALCATSHLIYYSLAKHTMIFTGFDDHTALRFMGYFYGLIWSYTLFFICIKCYQKPLFAKILSNSVIQYWGLISYSIYLCQGIVKHICGDSHYIISFCVDLFIMAPLTYKFIEKPAQSFGRYLSTDTLGARFLFWRPIVVYAFVSMIFIMFFVTAYLYDFFDSLVKILGIHHII